MAGEDDGLSWMFELDADLKGPTQLIDVLGRLDATLKHLDQGTKKVETGSHAAGAAHRKHGQEASGLTGVLHNLSRAFEPLEHHFAKVGEFEFFRRATDALIEAPEKMAEAIKELGIEMLLTAGKAERMNKAFGIVFGEEVGGETLDYIEHIAKFTEFTESNLKGSALQLAKMGFQGEGLTRALAASLDISAFSGSGAEGQGEALGALSRIKQSGRVEARTLRPLGINEGDFFKELAVRTGKGRKELKTEMEKGTLDVDQSLETLYTLITRRTKKDLGGAGVEMGETLNARLTHLKDIPEQMFEKLAKLPAFQKISDSIGAAVEALSPEGAQGGKIFDSLAGAFTRVGNALAGVDWPVVGDTIATVIDVVGTFVAGGIEFVDRFARGLDRLIGIFTGVPGAFGDALTSLTENLLSFGRWLVQPAIDIGMALVHGIVDGIRGGVTYVLDAVGNLGTSIVGKLKDTLGIHSPSLVFQQLGAMTGEGFAIGVESKGDRTESAIDETFGAARPSSGAGGRGGIVLNASMQVNVGAHGGDTDAMLEELRPRLRALLVGEMQSALEQFGIEGGSAA